jgi:hypothetical protein
MVMEGDGRRVVAARCCNFVDLFYRLGNRTVVPAPLVVLMFAEMKVRRNKMFIVEGCLSNGLVHDIYEILDYTLIPLYASMFFISPVAGSRT